MLAIITLTIIIIIRCYYIINTNSVEASVGNAAEDAAAATSLLPTATLRPGLLCLGPVSQHTPHQMTIRSSHHRHVPGGDTVNV